MMSLKSKKVRKNSENSVFLSQLKMHSLLTDSDNYKTHRKLIQRKLFSFLTPPNIQLLMFENKEKQKIPPFNSLGSKVTFISNHSSETETNKFSVNKLINRKLSKLRYRNG